MRTLLVALLVLLAGCAAPAADHEGDGAHDPAEGEGGEPLAPQDAGGDDAPPSEEPAPPASPSQPPQEQPSSPPKASSTVARREWPALDAATIRPGVQLHSATGQCTSNFVFTSPDNVTLYIGFAAHCVDGLEPGAVIDVGGVAEGTLAYSSWHTMEKVGETDEGIRAENDFALVALPPSAYDKVHPAMRHFGGPVALADSSTVGGGDKVLTYGNSGLRFETEPASWHEGYVLSPSDWSSTVYTVTPGVFGDSGSGVMTGDGRALGILVTLIYAPTPAANGVTHLDKALAYAKEHAGIDVRLATWELLDPGLLPAV